jgi:orotate phosphoribosyltransferase
VSERDSSGISEMKKEFVAFLLDAGALRFGDFTLKSGRRSPYFINAGAFDTGRKLARLGSFYAARIKSAMDAGEIPAAIDTVFGPAYKGIPIAAATAQALALDYGIGAGYTFNRKEAKDHGEGGSFVGRQPADGSRVVIVDDVITAGTAVRETVPLLRQAADVDILALVLMVDRMERGGGPEGLSAVEEVRRGLGILVLPIVTIRDIMDTAPGGASEDMIEYFREYCVGERELEGSGR